MSTPHGFCVIVLIVLMSENVEGEMFFPTTEPIKLLVPEIAEYVEYINDTRKMLTTNFLAGIARGLGMAVGFTILGALLIYFLRQLVLLNLPLIGDFIANLVELVNDSLRK